MAWPSCIFASFTLVTVSSGECVGNSTDVVPQMHSARFKLSALKVCNQGSSGHHATAISKDLECNR